MIEAALWAGRFGEALAVQQYAQRTVQSYQAETERFLAYLQGQQLQSLAGLTRNHLQAYQSHLFYLRYRGRKLKASSQAQRLNAVLAFVRFLVAEDVLLVDISQHLELPRKGQTLPRVVLSESETLRLLEGPDPKGCLGVRDRAILEVLYATGMRNSELRQLQLGHLDGARKLVLVEWGKGQKSRWLPMSEEAWIWVEEYLAQSRPVLAGAHSGTTVFLTRTGRRFGVVALAELVARWGKRVGLEKHVTPHCLRHTCATHMLRRGADLRVLQVLLGHAQVTTTQGYTRVEVSDLRQVLSRCHPRERLG